MTDTPDILIHVGLHKCGSTWLQKNVFSRVDYGVCTPWGDMAHMAVTEFVDVDPLCFDAAVVRAQFDESLAALGRAGADKVAVVSHEALSSRPHHGKYYAPEAAKRLRDTFPGAKVLVIFREQAAIIYSLYGEYVRNGGQYSFDEFIGTGQERPGWASLCKLSFFEYDRLVAMYQDMFGTENVLALPLELMRADPQAFSAEIFGFLGLASHAPDTAERSNKGWGALTVELYRLTNGLIRKNPLGGAHSRRYRARQFIAWRIDRVLPRRWNTALERRRKARLQARIAGVFEASNQRLSQMLGRDLGGLGYKVGPDATDVTGVTDGPDQPS